MWCRYRAAHFGTVRHLCALAAPHVAVVPSARRNRASTRSPIMSSLHTRPAPQRRKWDNDHTRIALTAARHHARRRARRARLLAADEEDLRQEAVLALLCRSTEFDGSQSAWSTFADLVVRHALFDRAVA